MLPTNCKLQMLLLLTTAHNKMIPTSLFEVAIVARPFDSTSDTSLPHETIPSTFDRDEGDSGSSSTFCSVVPSDLSSTFRSVDPEFELIVVIGPKSFALPLGVSDCA